MPSPPSRRRSPGALVSLAAAILIAVSLGAGASSATGTSRASQVPLSLWALTIDGRRGAEPDAAVLKMASSNDVQAVVTRRNGWTATREQELIKPATQLRLL